MNTLLMIDEGIIMKPDRSQGLTCYVDADFAGNWTPDQALDPRACLSRTGFVIFYVNCPIAWHSKLQTTISLSATEAEHVALSTAMRDVIHFINFFCSTASLPPTRVGPESDHRENLHCPSTCRHIYQSLTSRCISIFAKYDQRMANLCEGVS